MYFQMLIDENLGKKASIKAAEPANKLTGFQGWQEICKQKITGKQLFRATGIARTVDWQGKRTCKKLVLLAYFFIA
jgi:hypothetical protein